VLYGWWDLTASGALASEQIVSGNGHSNGHAANGHGGVATEESA
jgi:hypothetical protein